MKSLPVIKLLLVMVLSTGLAAEGKWSSNFGLMSEYHFRGVAQTTDASAYGGVDYENGGWYAGSWAADVNDGLEVDLYFGHNWQLDKVELSLGATSYQYSGDFDSEYNEVNLGFGFQSFKLDAAVGTRSEDLGLAIPEQDYTFLLATYTVDAFSIKLGNWSGDIEGSYLELGYGFTIGEFDTGIALIVSNSDLDDDETLVFHIGKSFDL